MPNFARYSSILKEIAKRLAKTKCTENLYQSRLTSPRLGSNILHVSRVETSLPVNNIRNWRGMVKNRRQLWPRWCRHALYPSSAVMRTEGRVEEERSKAAGTSPEIRIYRYGGAYTFRRGTSTCTPWYARKSCPLGCKDIIDPPRNSSPCDLSISSRSFPRSLIGSVLVLENEWCNQLSEIYISCLLTLPISGDHNSRLALFWGNSLNKKDRSSIVKFAIRIYGCLTVTSCLVKKFLKYERLRVIKFVEDLKILRLTEIEIIIM